MQHWLTCDSSETKVFYLNSTPLILNRSRLWIGSNVAALKNIKSFTLLFHKQALSQMQHWLTKTHLKLRFSTSISSTYQKQSLSTLFKHLSEKLYPSLAAWGGLDHNNITCSGAGASISLGEMLCLVGSIIGYSQPEHFRQGSGIYNCDQQVQLIPGGQGFGSFLI